MALKETIDADIKKAMLAKDKVRLQALRSIKSQIMLAETAEGAHGAALTEDAELKLLNKAAKQRREAAETYQKQFRSDLEEIELAELAIIEEYLPQQLSEADLVEKLVGIIQRVGATGPSDLGKVMGVAARELSGQADGKMISQVVSNLLNNTNV
ncbi:MULTISPECIES: GatB/YqeY domain-containing protein [Hymenobacter]|uniref:GatB/YqeY domain-containing protein n=2 Tax=Hymenobacter TaxID=89966 RepID=A0A4Z0QC54_9BACT|nr:MULTISPECIES: GatB/YqeY domain-containing protein [Hymenobacter]TGE26282.1 GatB/YqeY domain-containing protein [Hymenobacter metallicola]UOQ54531.1 GatB/YqeY domain-containing protein [Hymenobacter cellulosivorans]